MRISSFDAHFPLYIYNFLNCGNGTDRHFQFSDSTLSNIIDGLTALQLICLTDWLPKERKSLSFSSVTKICWQLEKFITSLI
jgi:hypothetical protein